MGVQWEGSVGHPDGGCSRQNHCPRGPEVGRSIAGNFTLVAGTEIPRGLASELRVSTECKCGGQRMIVLTIILIGCFTTTSLN